MYLKKNIAFVLLILFSFGVEDSLFAQQDPADDTVIQNDAKREEIQRYFGYELLLYRYLSLPYDVSVNVNQSGNYVDIGYLYLLFIPILVMLLLRRRILPLLLSMISILFLWVISSANGFIFSLSRDKIEVSRNAIDTYLSQVGFSQEPFTHLVCYLYKFSLSLYQPLLSIGNQISGNSDHVTYPIIFALFIVGSILLLRSSRYGSVEKSIFIVFLWVYSFYWFAFSGGIIWYGYILLITGLYFIYMTIDRLKEKDPGAYKLMHSSFIALGLIWMVMTLGLRTSDIQPGMDAKFFAKGMFNPVFYDYASGKIKKEKAADIIYSDVSTAFDRMNQETESYILRIGTSFNYFIKNNNNRVIQDNQLGWFYQLMQRYPNRIEMIDVLKASNIKYLMIDLNTSSIDYTPDKSLTAKFVKLMQFVINNPHLELLATDRVVLKKDANGNSIYAKDILGDQIYLAGRYVIYEIK